MTRDSQPVAVFHCLAAPAVGAGHVVRCLTLADALRARGWRVGFAVDAESRRTAPTLDAAGVDVRAATTPAEILAAWPGGADLAVVDRYGCDADFERALRPWARRLLAIDDLANRSHDVDMLLDSAGSETAYGPLIPAACERLLGPDYALLRPEFRRLREGGPARAVRARASRLLISLGGSDPHNATGALLDWLDRCASPLEITAVVGAAAPHREALAARARTMRHPTTVRRQISDMGAALAEADLVVGAGGNSAWERCCLATPTLLAVIAENQRTVAERLVAAGAAREVLHDPAGEPCMSLEAFEALLGDAAARGAMAAAAAALCDGLGADRVALAVERLCGRLSTRCRLRPAAQADRDVLLAWQRHPETRRHFRNPEPPDAAEHAAWFAAKARDPRCLMHMVEDADGAAGLVRLDLDGAGGAEVSILIAPDRRGRGVGAEALALIAALRPDLRLTAEVLPGNTASHRLFRKAGYRARSEGSYVRAPAGAPPA
ncbi:MAG: UDP-2,4-diacetamido-2,4,6-trideoxy-beta-L-altropyranose hydrolase [Alphaproteobacteria bacterium]|nr:UDP-2,4-diacetamido-2,4,6-trideoxy-beta-L-altropyranose hydrolase [Alphaproteobacteria bacterium]